MRTGRIVVSLIASLLLTGSAAHAAPLPYTGTLSIQLGTFPTLVMPGSGTALVNDGAGGALQLAGGTFGTVGATFPIPTPTLFTAVIFNIGIGAGSFGPGPATPMILPGPVPTTLFGVPNTGAVPPWALVNFNSVATPGAVGGVMPLTGNATICVGGNCNLVTVPITAPGAGAWATGTVTGLANIRVFGGAWTTGSARAFSRVRTSLENPTTVPLFIFAEATGFDTRTPAGGMVQMVTPIVVTNSVLPGWIPGFATLTLDFTPVPEPGTALLAAAAVGFLGLATRRRI